MTTPYKPASGIETFIWVQRSCVPCIHFVNPDPLLMSSGAYKDCELGIINRALTKETTDPEFPSEWTLENGLANCSMRCKGRVLS